MLACAMSGFDGPIYLTLRVSRIHVLAHVACHGAVLLLLFTWPPSLPRQAVLAIVIANAAWCVWRAVYPPHDAAAALLLCPRDTLTLRLIDGRVVHGALIARPFLSPALTALSVRCDDGRRREFAAFADNTDGDALRRLRVRLGRVAPSA
jgi:hypothetical protein